ncbi:MAG: ATP-grasp domain-containing protein [Candidatus Delongbacteria bacterium]|nr:ATP-grasp domain-containing protein [Candidatus Delongbacteria bacterium]MCG2760254.1 ATP-grasp domain-containing protein [Candidatus Delongbacteria bacterium]
MKITVAVSGINTIDNPGPGAGICRALKESGMDIRTIGLAYDALEPGIYLDHIIDKSDIMPYPSGSREAFIERIKDIHAKEKIDVIISALDAELPIYMDIEPVLEEIGIKMLIPTKEMFRTRDKLRLKELAEKIGVKAPEYISCASTTDLHNAVDKLEFPCMVKGPFYEAYKAYTIGEAESYFTKIAMAWGYPIIVQKFIEGDEYDVIGCGDGKGNDMGVFAIRKMTITKLGKVWNAVSVRNERLIEATKKVVKGLSWRGGFEFEVLLENKTQEIYVLEINPRFPAWVYFPAGCGINLPARMVQFLTGQKYESHSDYKSGKLMIRYTNELVKDIKDFEKISTFGES